ncbi:MAG: DUF192 domain-containing protein [Verrucomicrobia bacterium]|nr:DUF192 domain-containing protein [Verrucomicrobiota bacterium]MCH8525731.1 DUF192 domain-containing protein [Kiritimatiellia bacterium]
MTFQGPAVSVWQDGSCRIEQLKVAKGLFERGIGLMFRRNVPAACGAGFLFPRCRDLHSFGMRFPLDVVWLDDKGAILQIRRSIPPGKVIRGPKTARHVFEVKAGTLPDLSESPLEFRVS